MLLATLPIAALTGRDEAVKSPSENAAVRLLARSVRNVLLFFFDEHNRFPNRLPGPGSAVTSRLISFKCATRPSRLRSIGPSTRLKMVHDVAVDAAPAANGPEPMVAGALNGTIEPPGNITRP